MEELNQLALTLATQQGKVVEALQTACIEAPSKEGVENLAIALELFGDAFELAVIANQPQEEPEPEQEPTPTRTSPLREAVRKSKAG